MNHSIVNLITAIVLSVAIIFSWQHFYEKPRLQKLAKQTKAYNKQVKALKDTAKQNFEHKILSRNDAISSVKRVSIQSRALSGSISLKGLRLDDLTLLRYRQELDEKSPAVNLFSPSNSNQGYFAEIGWISSDKYITYPDSSTQWSADKSQLTAGGSVNFSWTSPENILFKVTVSLDEDYMFTIKQSTYNKSGRNISAQYYGLINRDYENKSGTTVNILHQGMIGAIAGELKEFSYEKIKDNKKESFASNELNWLGITDKYWLAAFIPDKSEQYSSNYNYALKNGHDKYQADFISTSRLIANGEKYELTHHLFAGAKKVALLDKYESKYDIKLFDRAIDFGWFYILTKPIFNAMNFFYKYVGNFGISIMIVTVLIKLVMFTIANRSYRSMKKMNKLKPQIERLKELYEGDKARMNQEIMQLYKKEKVNPVSGCLPMLIQLPVFFSIYKVLHVTIEMRHAPFFGWIKDLSAPDPTTIFNLFGLLPFSPPSFLMIGAGPLLMAASLFLLQRMTPPPADPMYAQIAKFTPVLLLFVFISLPAGLVVYSIWSNLLSIVQQSYINKLDKNDS